MSETISPEFIGRRLDSLQNNVSGVTRRMITLENTLSDRMAALETRLAGLEECADQLSDRISALDTRVNYLILLVEGIAQVKGLTSSGMPGDPSPTCWL
jgi:hypothetical protein